MDDLFGDQGGQQAQYDAGDDFDDDDTGMDMDADDGADEEITQEDAWVVIGAYFHEKGLVGQQLDSFDEFMNNMIQELVNDVGTITVTPENQYIPGEEVEQVE
jgi:DNA-directed RNA polymerase II subunit RPB2